MWILLRWFTTSSCPTLSMRNKYLLECAFQIHKLLFLLNAVTRHSLKFWIMQVRDLETVHKVCKIRMTSHYYPRYYGFYNPLPRKAFFSRIYEGFWQCGLVLWTRKERKVRKSEQKPRSSSLPKFCPKYAPILSAFALNSLKIWLAFYFIWLRLLLYLTDSVTAFDPLNTPPLPKQCDTNPAKNLDFLKLRYRRPYRMKFFLF